MRTNGKHISYRWHWKLVFIKSYAIIIHSRRDPQNKSAADCRIGRSANLHRRALKFNQKYHKRWNKIAAYLDRTRASPTGTTKSHGRVFCPQHWASSAAGAARSERTLAAFFNVARTLSFFGNKIQWRCSKWSTHARPESGALKFPVRRTKVPVECGEGWKRALGRTRAGRRRRASTDRDRERLTPGWEAPGCACLCRCCSQPLGVLRGAATNTASFAPPWVSTEKKIYLTTN